MKTYADANALVKLYLHLPGRYNAVNFLAARPAKDTWPLPITDLLKFEVSNAIERTVFESRTGGPWRVNSEIAMMAQGDFAADLSEALEIKRVPLTLGDLEREFESLVRRHTARLGFRTYDIIHVASAVTLRCERFLSFDANANALAKLVGLETVL